MKDESYRAGLSRQLAILRGSRLADEGGGVSSGERLPGVSLQHCVMCQLWTPSGRQVGGRHLFAAVRMNGRAGCLYGAFMVTLSSGEADKGWHKSNAQLVE